MPIDMTTETTVPTYSSVHGDGPHRDPFDVCIQGAAGVNIFAISSGSAVAVGTAVVSNVSVADAADSHQLQTNPHGQALKPEE